MNTKFKFLLSFTLALAGTNLSAQHIHINTGAYDASDRGYIVDGDALIANNVPSTPIEFVYNEGEGVAGSNGFFFDSDFTLAAYDSYYYNTTTQIGGAIEGSSVWIELWGVSDGPLGGVFAFFDVGYIDPTILASVGEVAHNYGSFTLSEPEAAPNAYGHIHGRTYAVSKPGTYETVWKLVDKSGNQADSEFFTITVMAVPEPAEFALLAALSMLLLVAVRRRR